MKMVSEAEVAERLRALPGPDPRVVVSGNFATPWQLVRLLDATLARCRAFVMNPQAGWPVREGFVTETPFVGPGVRDDQWLDYLPMRLSLVPRLFGSLRPPDAVLVHTSTPRAGKVSLGIEVNILPAAIEAGAASRRTGRGPGEPADALHPRRRRDRREPGRSRPSRWTRRCRRRSIAPLDDAASASVRWWPRSPATTARCRWASVSCPTRRSSSMRAKKRYLGVWSEMVSDGVMHLEHAGVLDCISGRSSRRSSSARPSSTRGPTTTRDW